ncbi:hypothetical protein MSPP1_001679 [Malassezia sp. CBS 17886]|nr:hypothetical protein MSPP1_001679 [Malassezia sp. CBS 17886]
MYQRFRWTSKNTPLILLWGFAVPSLLFYGIANTDYRWNFLGKTRGESLLRVPPAANVAAEQSEE